MNQHPHKRARWALLLVPILLVALYPAQQSITQDPAYPEEYQTPVYNIREGGTFAIMAMMGGFRPLVANLLWLKSDQYWHQGATGWWRMVPVLQTVCEMDPHFIDAWSTFGWHCAWNIYADAAAEDKPKWVETGIRVYKRGIYFNPERYDLYKDLAWLYHDKIKDYDRSIPAWKRVLEFPDAPEFVRHLLAHAYEISWRWEEALEVWRDCVRVNPYDQVARSAIEWWEEQSSTPEKLNAELLRILERENRVRITRRLPPMEQPFPLE